MTAKSGFGVGGVLVVVFAAIGYFLYGGMNGFFAIFLLSILFEFAILLSVIPFIGPAVQGWVSFMVILPAMESFAGIQSTWLTTLMIIVYIVCGLHLWYMTTAIAVFEISDKVRYLKYWLKYGRKRAAQKKALNVNLSEATHNE
jgi:hypothetical protein